MNMKHKIQYLLFFLALPFSMMAENASNVRTQQRNKDIIITYDLAKTSNVTLWVATGRSNSFRQLFSVDGAVGKHIRKGENLTIVWHPLDEYGKFIEDNVRFKVEALGSYGQYALPKTRGGISMGGRTNMETFILADFAYAFAPQMSGGLMFGQTYSGYGWYVNARTNFSFATATNGLECGKGGYVGDVLPFYSGQQKSSLLVANVGFVMDIVEAAGAHVRNRFNTFGFYIGAGYGNRQMLWETTDGQWVKYTPTSHTGFNTEIGLIGSVYGLTLKAGVSTINFQYMELEAGIGWMF